CSTCSDGILALRSVLIYMPAINQASEMSRNSVARPFEPLPKFRLTDAVREQMLPSDSAPKRIFLLSPANIAGIRAGQVMSGHARSDLAIVYVMRCTARRSLQF